MKTIMFIINTFGLFGIFLEILSSKVNGKRCGENEFLCSLEDFCLPRQYVCDGYTDCLAGDDESNVIAGCCEPRNLTEATLKNRPCRKSCTSDQDCETGSCICDNECGTSCVNTDNTCFSPPSIPHQKSITVMRKNEDGQLIEVTALYKFQDYAYYDCAPGYELVPNVSRRCHSKQNWTESIQCALSCKPKISQNCWNECVNDTDCRLNWKCLCDGNCGRSCVPLDFVYCGQPPLSPNAVTKYNESGFDAIAHYICKDGYYPQSGDNFLRCTGLGLWEGEKLICKAITCSDPSQSIRKTGGFVINRKRVWKVNDTVTFSCRHTHRMLGSKKRTCLPNGRWSGKLTRCDEIISNVHQREKEVCPHPGVPINGKMIGSSFKVGSQIRFECNVGYFMVGESVQECTWLLQWSSGGAPFCADLRYDNIPSQFFGKISNMMNKGSTEDFVSERSININAETNELLFVFHLHKEANLQLLKIKIHFINLLLDKLESAATTLARVGVIVYAQNAKTLIDIYHEPHLRRDEINKKLLQGIMKDLDTTVEEVGSGNNIEGVFEYLYANYLVPSYSKDDATATERHIFLLTDKIPDVGGVSKRIRERIEQQYVPLGWIEFYCITTAEKSKDASSLNSLMVMASKPENFIYIQDYDHLNNAIEKFILPDEDFSKCGVPGDVSSVLELAKVDRVVGGVKSMKAAWPWQAVVCKYKSELHTMYNNFNYFFGGGSLINDKWVLTAAHLFKIYVGDFAHLFTVSLGLIRRPKESEALPSYAKIFRAEKIIKHSKYNHRENPSYDYALIKIGKELLNDGEHFMESTEEGETSIKFNHYIRPVCLPCMKENCVKEVLKTRNKNGQILLQGNESQEEQCRIELDYLFGDGKGGAVVVGFGSNKTRGQLDLAPLALSRNLHHVLKKLQNDTQCERGMSVIRQNVFSQRQMKYFVFTDQMMCATNYKESVFKDSCQGDSGGPLLREVYNEVTDKGFWVQLGIVSFGFGCAQTYLDEQQREVMFPAFYSNVLEQIDWIKVVMKGETMPPDDVKEKDIDECMLGTHNCSAHAACQNTEGSYNCTCNMGYHGNGEICQDINECTSTGLTKHNCSKNADCFNNNGSFTCTCKSGFTGDGKICNAPKCSSPKLIDNAHEVKLVNKYNFGSVFTFTCKRGFILVGNHQITCTEQGSWTKYPSCDDINECTSTPTRHDCSNNAICRNTKGSYLCNCKDGFTGSGVFCKDIDECSSNQHNCSENAKCLNTEGFYECICNSGYVGDGRLCQGVNCPAPPIITKGNPQILKKSYAFGDKVTYVCSDGYKVIGNDKVVCQENGKWSHIPICQQINCPSPPNIENAMISFVWGYKVGDFVRYSCRKGFKMIGQDLIRCQQNGEWTAFPQCETTKCPAPKAIANTIERSFAKEYPVESLLIYTCKDGYKMIDSSRITCQEDGTWTVLPRCNAIKCGRLQNIPNAVEQTFRREYLWGSTVTFSCKSGYQRIGNYRVSCEETGWSEFPRCNDLNECTRRTHKCSKYAICSNTPGSYTCKCNSGYTGSGTSCYDVNECKGNHRCAKNTICENTPGSYLCKAPATTKRPVTTTKPRVTPKPITWGFSASTRWSFSIGK